MLTREREGKWKPWINIDVAEARLELGLDTRGARIICLCVCLCAGNQEHVTDFVITTASSPVESSMPSIIFCVDID